MFAVVQEGADVPDRGGTLTTSLLVLLPAGLSNSLRTVLKTLVVL